MAHIDVDELAPGMGVGPYELVAQVGAGGMARVWVARVRGTSDVVALKILLPDLSDNIEFRKMFFDEANIASRVHHPNVCATYGLREDGGLLYLAMEWVDGPSLMRVLRPGDLDVTEAARLPIRPRVAARIVADACAGLHAAHELRGDDGRPLDVVHRDVSPHNLLLATSGAVRITDFGVAKAIGKSHMTIAGQLKGKIAYMAPEQLAGGAVDRRTDVFALGCVLYEITTGKRPFQGEHDPQVMTAIMLGHYEPPGAIVASYPHELAIVVMRALSTEPGHRYPSAEHMRLALETYLQNSGPAVGSQHVAELVRERCGAEIATMHARVSGTGAAGAGGMGTTPRARPEAIPLDGETVRPRSVLYLVSAALVGAALGMGVLSYVRSVRSARKAKATAASVLPAASANASATASATTTASAGTVLELPSTSGSVHLKIEPASAVVLVDGVVLPRGTDVIARPTNGLTMTVLVRADKYDDTVVLVDGATPDEVEVSLVPSIAAAPSSSAIAAPGTTSSTAATPKPRNNPAASAGREPHDPASEMPPNPY